MKVSILRHRSATVIVNFPPEISEEPLTIVYNPTTEEIQKQYNEHGQKLIGKTDENGILQPGEWNQVRRMAEDLAITIRSWDMYNEDGSMVPVSVESLRTFDAFILNHISVAITEHMYPPRKASGN